MSSLLHIEQASVLFIPIMLYLWEKFSCFAGCGHTPMHANMFNGADDFGRFIY